LLKRGEGGLIKNERARARQKRKGAKNESSATARKRQCKDDHLDRIG